MITITEHVKGQIKGQLSFDDLGFVMEDIAEPEDPGCDPETGEIMENKQEENTEKPAIVDFRKIKEG